MSEPDSPPGRARREPELPPVPPGAVDAEINTCRVVR